MLKANKRSSFVVFYYDTPYIILYKYLQFIVLNSVAMANKNIINIRKKLDKLDNQFLNIIKKRTLLVDQVLKNKKFKKDIIDKKRIKIIIKNIAKKSKNKKIDPRITIKIWKTMIRSYIEYEFRNFKKK